MSIFYIKYNLAAIDPHFSVKCRCRGLECRLFDVLLKEKKSAIVSQLVVVLCDSCDRLIV